MKTITKLNKTCNICPTQWDAEDSEGQTYYIRYRYGNLTVHKDGPLGDTILEKSYGHVLDGIITFSKLRELTKDVLTFECEEVKER